MWNFKKLKINTLKNYSPQKKKQKTEIRHFLPKSSILFFIVKT